MASTSSTPARPSDPPPPYDSELSEPIERVLYVHSPVHIYAIPPLTSTKGHQASTWTKPPARQIFTARLRLLETSRPIIASSSSDVPPTPPTPSAPPAPTTPTTSTHLTVTLLLEDPADGTLFAAAPYTSPSAVDPALDSSRFFAVRVEGEGGRRAVLGLGFEERADAFDFGVALQEARKVLGWDIKGVPGTPGTPGTPSASLRTAGRKGMGMVAKWEMGKMEAKRDWGLKEGEVLHVDIGTRGKERKDDGDVGEERFIAPPSGGGIGGNVSGDEQVLNAFKLAPPPPSARDVRAERRKSREFAKDLSAGLGVGGEKDVNRMMEEESKKLEQLGFDDGEFGEFQ